MAVKKVLGMGSGLRIRAAVEAAGSRCPDCGGLWQRVHSRYRRRLLDLAIGGREVVIDLLVRRFFCDNGDCARKTFVEQVDGVTRRHARHTEHARQVSALT